MSRFWRNLLCVLAGLITSLVGTEIVFIFWPLIFPQNLQGHSTGEDALPFIVIAFFLSFAAAGFLLVRKLTKKYARNDHISR
ncbi:hypothetical protein [Occallatibacter savannae]|uniref:hypothetical protein n=1 Tax=Occallatibacter savannae TaxID=1002691 RepID=UPI000D69AACA|nr:hypothetical protein [Occallatibacter savannae]